MLISVLVEKKSELKPLKCNIRKEGRKSSEENYDTSSPKNIDISVIQI